MRIFWLALVVVLALCLTSSAHAQWPLPWPYPPAPQYPPPEHSEHALTLGLWGELGGQGKLGPGVEPQEVIPAGVYLELSKHRLRPALEVRGVFSPYGVRGTLTGPRVAWKVDQAIFYASALFGPNHYTPYSSAPTPAVDQHGVTSEAVGGVELMSLYHPNWGFRMEASTARFTGAPQSYPLTIAVGVVLRVP